MTTLRLATRQSPLALSQSRWVADRLQDRHPGLRVELVGLTTSGDTTVGPLADAGGKGLFTKEVELALLRGDADLAVHSFKDVPVTMPLVEGVEEELVVAAVPTREDPRDAIISRRPLPTSLDGLRIGTGSPRRIALLRDLWPDAIAVPIRGNVDSRIAKIGAGEVDAVVLAMAGLNRLSRLRGLTIRPLAIDSFTPAAGQGALAVQCRQDDAATRRLLASVNDEAAQRAVEVERDVVRLLDGDCHSPIGAHVEGSGTLHVAFEEAGRLLRGRSSGGAADAVADARETAAHR